MKLEDEIKQKSFRSEHHKMVLNIYFTNNWLHDSQINIFKSFAITPQQFNLLRILRGQYPTPATINLLVERMLNKMCDASRLVEKLKKKGLVERVQCPEDRRAVNVLISEKGLKLLKEIDPLLDQMYDELSSILTVEEAKQLNNLLDKLRK
ncbi:MAG TPA: MarR family transcriptional regulator [Cytophagales bacterium]|nr:MarR family transcriptional regulator [Cytophagales bacterium]